MSLYLQYLVVVPILLLRFIDPARTERYPLIDTASDGFLPWTKYGEKGLTEFGWKYQGKVNGKSESYAVCDANITSSNWLFSPWIEKNDIEVMDVEIRFEIWCPSQKSCKQDFDVYYFPIDNDQKMEDSKLLRYRRLVKKVNKNKMDVLRLPTITTAGFYLGINSLGTCIRLNSFKVFYKACPQLIENLVSLPFSITGKEVFKDIVGECVPYASSRITPLRTCQNSGTWYESADGNTCACNPGYEPNENSIKCSPCPASTYKPLERNTPCNQCPLNSNTKGDGNIECKCNSGFYRASDESVDFPCASTPSAPREESTFVDKTTVRLKWKAPQSSNGRNHVWYRITCHSCKDDRFPLIANRTTHTFVGLSPERMYLLKIESLNSVSHLVGNTKHLMVKFTTGEALLPRDVSLIKDKSQLTVLWAPPSDSDQELDYVVKVYKQGSNQFSKLKRTNSTYMTFSNLEPGKYAFQVGIANQKGVFAELVNEEIYESDVIYMPKMGARHLGVVIGVIGTLFLLFLVLCFGVVILYRRRIPQKWTDISTMPHAHDENGILMQSHIGQTFIDPSFYEEPGQILADFTTELNEQCLQINSQFEKLSNDVGLLNGILRKPHSDDGVQVSVKVLQEQATMESRRRFSVEAAILGQFNHPNVLMLYGVITTPDLPWMMVTEYVDRGPLYLYLQNLPSKLSPLQLVHVIRGVACGMHYLSDLGYIHKVLTSGNILLSTNFVCKISGFDMKATLEELSVNSQIQKELLNYLLPWSAPEIVSSRKYSSASDVWSFGVVMWETMSQGDSPYSELENDKIAQKILNSFKLPIPMGCPRLIYSLILECWNDERSQRPSFSQIKNSLEQFIRRPTLLDDFSKNMHLSTNNICAISPESSTYLQSLNLYQYIDLFCKAGYTQIDDLSSLDDEQLKIIGVKDKHHRKQILSNLPSSYHSPYKTLPSPCCKLISENIA